MQDSQPNKNENQVTKDDCFAAALRGEVPLRVGDVIQRSWDITLRALPIMLVALALMLVVNYVIGEITAVQFPVDENNPNLANVAWQTLIGMVIMAPFNALVQWLGILNARDVKPSFANFSHAFRSAPQVIGIQVVMSVLIMVASTVFYLIFGLSSVFLALVVVTAAYLQLSFTLAVPLVLDRGLSVQRAILASVMILSKRIFAMLGIYIVMFFILFISALPLLLGLIFTLPMTFNVIGVIYNRMIGLPSSEQPLPLATDDQGGV